MKSKVYFVKVKESENADIIGQKLSLLIGKSGLFDFLKPGNRVSVKMHFGEEGNTGYVKPGFVRIACGAVQQKQAVPFVSDTNTLYRGRRLNSAEHIKLASEHGFTKDSLGAEVLIPDDTKKENIIHVEIGRKYIKTAKIARHYAEADAILGIAHFKGHIMTGFGGALKNLGMGCATREGKLAQHSDISPFVIMRKCVGCGACEVVCPVKAITLVEKKSRIDGKKCIGCASCIAACKYEAIELNWEAGGSAIQEKMVEYAEAVLKNKKDRCAFLNFATKITAECDCLAKDDPRISPDVGIFASHDPVAADKASFDAVLKAARRDIFRQAHPSRDGMKQLIHAQELGLGSMDYDLVEVN
jgi:uncharacterized protein